MAVAAAVVALAALVVMAHTSRHTIVHTHNRLGHPVNLAPLAMAPVLMVLELALIAVELVIPADLAD